MLLYVVPAAIALILKIYILVASVGNPALKQWRVLVLGFLVFNALELGMLLVVNLAGIAPELVVRTYYVFLSGMLLGTSVFVGDMHSTWQRFALQLWVGVFVAIAVLCYTDLFFTRAEIVGHSVRMVKTSHFWLLGVAGISWVLFLAFTCAHNYWRLRGSGRELWAYYNALSITPYAVVVAMGSVCLSMGWSFNSAALVPLASTAFLFISLRAHSYKDIKMDWRAFTSSQERDQHKALLYYLAQFNAGNLSYSEIKPMIERTMLQYALEKNDSNISAAARAAGLPRSTFLRRAKKLMLIRSDKNQYH